MKTKTSELTMPKHLSYALVVMALLYCYMPADAQQKNLIGIHSSVEWGQGYGIRNISGVVYERKFGQHFGIETGALFNNLRVYSDGAGLATPARINHVYLNVPLLFKYYSNIVNVAAGPTLNTRLAMFRTGNLYRQLPDPVVGHPASSAVGYQFKISKSIPVKDRFVLEPEVNIGNKFEFKKPSVGIGASFKYSF